MKTSIVITTLVALALLPADAGSSAPSIHHPELTTTTASPWTFQFDLYGWAEALNGDIGIKGFSAPVDISFSDILENLDFAVMGAVGIGYGRWNFLADVVYAEIGNSGTKRGVWVKVEEEQFLGNFALGYEVLQSHTMNLNLYAGARVNSIDVNLQLDDRRGRAFSRSGSKTWVDPILGARFQAEFSDSWFFRAVGDIGGFGVASDLTWQAMAGFGYRLNDCSSLLLGYRALGTDYANGGFTYDLTAYGPVFGFEYKF
ncbi:MAG: hypothetical protein NTW21_26540 [Verrucomicrobia bacterium]|nr:hypothetical protein [Verrucomicrobiota bacterium]